MPSRRIKAANKVHVVETASVQSLQHGEFVVTVASRHCREIHTVVTFLKPIQKAVANNNLKISFHDFLMTTDYAFFATVFFCFEAEKEHDITK